MNAARRWANPCAVASKIAPVWCATKPASRSWLCARSQSARRADGSHERPARRRSRCREGRRPPPTRHDRRRRPRPRSLPRASPRRAHGTTESRGAPTASLPRVRPHTVTSTTSLDRYAGRSRATSGVECDVERRYRHAGADRFCLAPAIDELADGQALKAFVCFLALCARRRHRRIPRRPVSLPATPWRTVRPRCVDAHPRVPHPPGSLRPRARRALPSPARAAAHRRGELATAPDTHAWKRSCQHEHPDPGGRRGGGLRRVNGAFPYQRGGGRQSRQTDARSQWSAGRHTPVASRRRQAVLSSA
jgi:hypothetical protein